jgi:hypothetical protein
MCARLTELVTQNYRRLNPTSDVAEGRKLSAKTWTEITSQLNVENPYNKKSSKQVMDNWANLKKMTKKKVHQTNKLVSVYIWMHF